MDKIESFVYHLVSAHPKLKFAIRNIYQEAFDLLPVKKNFFSAPVCCKEGCFFGFHDLSPLSEDDTKCLAQQLFFDGRMPESGEPVSVGYCIVEDGQLGEYVKIDDSFSWNYHKGCRLQWYGKDTVIFNTVSEGKLSAEICDLKEGTKRFAGSPVDTVYASGNVATSFSYGRLEYCMPGYGYPYEDGEAMLDDDFPKETGLFLLDLRSGEKKLLVSLYELAMSAPQYTREGYKHFVTHSEFSPDGRYISFLHRWIRNGGDRMKRWTRIMVYDTADGSLRELPSQISGSHYVWNHRHQLLASCVIDGKSCHVLFDMHDLEHFRVIAGDVLNSDGHQSFIDDETFVTDTYPDKRRMAKLYKVHIPSQKVELLAELHSPKQFQSFRKNTVGHIACDLHPRVSSSADYLSFDSPTNGKRALYLMKL